MEISTDPGREVFEAIDLPQNGAIGDEPAAIAQALYGTQEFIEGNYTEESLFVGMDPTQAVLLFTRLGLADDSVRGIRYRLEFVPYEGEQWELVWAGQQFMCWPGRGHENWETELCY
ncbi:MAG: hypothetical protein F6K42_08785 [Leptolyngbya sp. SIO1D8]|nr:hypothetical protein [Leptolyngbya sp. SIO1D8]